MQNGMLPTFLAATVLLLGLLPASGAEPPEEPARDASEKGAPPAATQRHLEKLHGRYGLETTVVDFAWGDLDADGTDDLALLYRVEYPVPPSKKSRGQATRQRQTVLAAFVRADGALEFAEDIRIPWCQDTSCRGLAVMDSGEIVIRRAIPQVDGGAETTLWLRYAAGRFHVDRPPTATQ